MKRFICRGKTEKGEWVKGYPHWSDKNQNWHIHDIDSHETKHDVIEKSIGRYVGEIDGGDVFEGDIIEEVLAETVYQTHYGANIPTPNGEYTEPIDVDIRYNHFAIPEFTIENLESIMTEFLFKQKFDESGLYELFSLGGNEGEDKELIKEFCAELGVKANSIDEVLFILNDFRVVGNLFDNPELLED